LWNLTTNSFALVSFRWWLLGAACASTLVAAAVEAWRRVRASVGSRVWVQPLGTAIRRTGLENSVVALLTKGASQGADVALVGPGGFGKTTLARQVCWNPAVRRRFGHAVWVTVGPSPSPADVLASINDVYWRLSGQRLDAHSLEQASHTLGSLLDRIEQPVLLIVDDVWRHEDLQPFLGAGAGCTRLITTRRPGILPMEIQDRSVRIDQFTPAEARAGLRSGIPELPEADLRDILHRTGRWPLLVALAHARLRVEIVGGCTPAEAAQRLRDLLGHQGPTSLRLDNADSRNRAAALSIEASLSLLDEMDPDGRERFHQLGVFGAEVDIPRTLLEAHWDLDSTEVDALCERLYELSLVTDYDRVNRSVRLHDVVRSILRAEHPVDPVLANDRILSAVERQVPRDVTGRRQWWHLVGTDPYWPRHLCRHLSEGGRDKDLVDLLLDLRWAEAKLGSRGYGPLSLDADFATCPDSTVSILRRAIRQSAHLLGPMTPEHALADTIVSRLADIEEPGPSSTSTDRPCLRPVESSPPPRCPTRRIPPCSTRSPRPRKRSAR
jgi:hypothetical protein